MVHRGLLSNHWACLRIRVSNWPWVFAQLLSLLVCLCYDGVLLMLHNHQIIESDATT